MVHHGKLRWLQETENFFSSRWMLLMDRSFFLIVKHFEMCQDPTDWNILFSRILICCLTSNWITLVWPFERAFSGRTWFKKHIEKQCQRPLCGQHTCFVLRRDVSFHSKTVTLCSLVSLVFVTGSSIYSCSLVLETKSRNNAEVAAFSADWFLEPIR